MNDKKDWTDEPTPLCAPYYGHWATTCTDDGIKKASDALAALEGTLGNEEDE